MSKIDFTGPEYYAWLHKLTTAGYKRNITIPTDHSDAIMGIYALKGDEDIEKCLDRYEQFCQRWIALHEPGGDFNSDKRVYNLPVIKTPLHDINQVIIRAGGMDIKVVGNTITFTIGQTNWEMSVGELEAVLESHDKLISALRFATNLLKDGYVDADVSPTVKMAEEALKRAE